MPGHPKPTSAAPYTEVTGLILAGGRGVRLGGADKGLLELAGRPLVRHVFERLAPQVGNVLLSANRNQARYRALGLAPLDDGPYPYAGPLAGLRAGLLACATPWLLAVACDLPRLPRDLCARLLAAAPPHDTRARVPFDGTRHQYACLLLPADALTAVESSLRAGRHSLHALLAAIGWLGVDFAADMRTQNAFANLNTPADIDTLTCPQPP
ncbi:MAG: molybdenum cofactor guanylyltransferase [Immundisolibacter sp.]